MWTGGKYSSQRGAWHDKKKNGTSRHVSMEFMTKIKTARNWKAGISILEEMEERGIEANAYHYSATIAKCKRQGRWMEAVGLLQKMKDVGMELNVVCYNATIISCGKRKQWEMALQLFQ